MDWKSPHIAVIVACTCGGIIGVASFYRDGSTPPPQAPSAVVSSHQEPEPPPPPPALSEAPKPASKLLGEYTTVFKTNAKDARVSNIELGAEMLDGNVIEPGETWSFNESIGPRTKERGFEDAPTLVMGEVIPGVGGGMCQVSSTLFAAALHIGLDPVRRLSHSRPSSYIPKGLDASVNYPEQCWKGQQDPNICFDLKLKNPYDFPIEIKTKTSKDSDTTRKLTVMLFGTGDVATVETSWVTYSTPDFKRVWRRNIWKAGTWKKKKQKGEPGLSGARVINTRWPDGRKTQDILVSRYRPQNEIWWVGKDWEGGDPWAQ